MNYFIASFELYENGILKYVDTISFEEEKPFFNKKAVYRSLEKQGFFGRIVFTFIMRLTKEEYEAYTAE